MFEQIIHKYVKNFEKYMLFMLYLNCNFEYILGVRASLDGHPSSLGLS